jgi:hypothetical protein
MGKQVEALLQNLLQPLLTSGQPIFLDDLDKHVGATPESPAKG